MQWTNVVVGAGLAGRSYARWLGEQRKRMLLVDRKSRVDKSVHTTGIFVRRTLEDFALPEHCLGPAVRDLRRQQAGLAVDVINEFLRDRNGSAPSRHECTPYRKRFRARSLMRRGLATIQHPWVAKLGFALLRLPPLTPLARHVLVGRGSFPLSDRELQACREFRAT